ncbi:MAG TPA: 16S rRNA (adenine(1518)-N(6)/adenine(1519)-N(6))-dimethyltransferase RsmA [Candidatus Paceibacterota bacterium]
MFARKSLGQNFLKDKEVLKDIIAASEIKPGEVVLEIGPGLGVLTEALLQAGATVIAVEKDERLISELQKRFALAITAHKLYLVHDDALEFSISNFQFSVKSQFSISNYKIVANIPYYITGALLEKFLTEKVQPSRMVLLVQKEVAERITVKDGKESILSISVKAYGTPSIVRYVSKESFEPVPKVDSAILQIGSISRDFFTAVEPLRNEKRFFELVKKGFAHKRKKLSSNLKLQGSPLELVGNRRAEELSLDDWRELYNSLESSRGR